jgi:hypothetical protein
MTPCSANLWISESVLNKFFKLVLCEVAIDWFLALIVISILLLLVADPSLPFATFLGLDKVVHIENEVNIM